MSNNCAPCINRIVFVVIPVAGVLQGDTLAPFLFIIALYYSLWQSIRNTSIGFMLEKRQGSRKPPIFITDIDFADDLALP